MTRIDIIVLGTPAPKGSSRAMLNKKTGRAMFMPGGSKVNREKLQTWDENVRAASARAAAVGRGFDEGPLFVGIPVRVHLAFGLVRPAGHWGKGKRAGQLLPSAPRFPMGKPDIDKLARSTLDSLTGVIFDDDSRVVSITCVKRYAAPGDEGCAIAVEEMP